MTDLLKLNHDVTTLGEKSAHEAFHDAFSRVAAAKQQIGDLEKLLKAAALEHVLATGPFVIGDIEYRACKPKKVTCVSVRAAATAVLELGGPDALEQCLSSSAFKHGATKTVLETLGAPEQYGNLFTETWEDQLEVKPVNKKFLKKGSSNAAE